MQNKITLPSGHTLVSNGVSFSHAGRLRRLVAAELLKVNLSFSDGIFVALLAPALSPAAKKQRLIAALGGTDANTIKDLFLTLMGSEELESHLFACMAKWHLEGEAVKESVFEADDRREDFLPCAWEVMKVGLLPFFGSLASLSKTLASPEESASPT